ncbi:MAG: hypothetical protein HRT36_01385 [Alphaproteobacteria bacterium]|nr:hypothetical protein [Alphaproteobacteria bacterium]
MLIDRIIVLIVGDQGTFQKGLKVLQKQGKISRHEKDIIEPVLQAGHAATHRGWAANDDQLTIILGTIENLIHKLLVLPFLSRELEEAVPKREKSKSSHKKVPALMTMKKKIDQMPKSLRQLYEALKNLLVSFGGDIHHPSTKTLSCLP